MKKIALVLALVMVFASEAVNGKLVKVSFVKEGSFVFLTELEVYGK